MSDGAAPANWRIEVRGYADPVVVEMVQQLQQIFVERYGGPDEAAVEPDDFTAPLGHFVVGFLGDVPAATGGWRRRPDGTAEIKRMYVVPAFQRRGLSRLVLAHLEQTARAAGITELVLNTGEEQPEAIALYRSAGYRVVPGFGFYARHASAHFYGKVLGD